MSILSKIWQSSRKFILNKYFIVIFIYSVFLIFIVDNNLIVRWQTAQKINLLEKEYEYFQNEIKDNKIKMHKLLNDKVYLEKFAREEYYMKKKGEEIFIIKE